MEMLSNILKMQFPIRPRKLANILSHFGRNYRTPRLCPADCWSPIQFGRDLVQLRNTFFQSDFPQPDSQFGDAALFCHELPSLRGQAHSMRVR